MSLHTIPLDVLRYVVIPYLRIDNVICIASSFTPTLITARCCFKQPHGIVSHKNRITANIHYYNGKRHNDGAPALVCSTGDEVWFYHGKIHREDGPAVFSPMGGGFIWFHQDKKHRAPLAGPAVLDVDGKFWYQDDRLHNYYGPAVIYRSGVKQWWMCGKRCSERAVKLKRKALEAAKK